MCADFGLVWQRMDSTALKKLTCALLSLVYFYFASQINLFPRSGEPRGPLPTVWCHVSCPSRFPLSPLLKPAVQRLPKSPLCQQTSESSSNPECHTEYRVSEDLSALKPIHIHIHTPAGEGELSGLISLYSIPDPGQAS